MSASKQFNISVSPMILITQYSNRLENESKEKKIRNNQQIKTVEIIKETLSQLNNSLNENESNNSEKSNLFNWEFKEGFNKKVLLDLDFSPLDQKKFNHILTKIKCLSGYKKTFMIDKIIPSGEIILEREILKISDQLRKDNRTSKNVATAKQHLLTKNIIYNPASSEPNWNLEISFAGSPLNHYEIQKILWDIINLNSEKYFFNITNINFESSFAIPELLLDPSRKNKQYLEVDSHLVAQFLNHIFLKNMAQ